MGHLINPISTRLGFTSFWISTWSSFSLRKFSYNLMVDNAIRELILWSFLDSRVSIQLSTVGVFLSHFKIIRRFNKIRVFIFLILNSSRLLKSQSIEVDPSISILESELLDNEELPSSFSEKRFVNSSLMKNKIFSDEFNKNLLFFEKNVNLFRNLTVFNFTKVSFLSFLSNLFSLNFNRFFILNSTFNSYSINIDISFLKNPFFLSSKFLSRFISRRLSFGFELNRVLNPIVSDLTRLVDSTESKIQGFRIACSGRFNKTQMASYSWEKYGPIPLNNFSCSVDYSFSKVFMRYGLCGIKVWVFTSHRPLKNFKSNLLKSFYNFKTFSLLFLNKKRIFSSVWLKLVSRLFLFDSLFDTSNFLVSDTELSSFLMFFFDSASFIKFFKNVS